MMGPLEFGAVQWLWALALLPLLAGLYFRAERRSAERLKQFVAANLLPHLAGTVNRRRRAVRFGFLLIAIALGIVALAQPRWGYTYDEAKRKGLDLLLAVDTSRSMLSNDVPPSRLERVKLATQDLINELQGDRVGVIAFAGRAFLQAPLTIDYTAAVDALLDLDTTTIPEGGTNISAAINLAVSTFGKSAMGNRALIIFTDGEELSGDATKTAKTAADAGVRVFTIGVGTPEGSLIPLQNSSGGTAFVKDSKGQVVKSKLDEKRLGEIARETGGMYLHLENGQATMKQVVREGLAKMQAGDIDARLSRRPIERYQWPLGAACIALAGWFLVSERGRSTRVRSASTPPVLAQAAALVLLCTATGFAASPGLDAYRDGRYPDALKQFEQTLAEHPRTEAADKLQFDTGAAAYKSRDYNKALGAFSQALLSKDTGLQSRSHYNLGNTLYQRGEQQKADDKKLGDWTNALQHYEQTLKLEPQNKEAKENYEFVKKKIEELKKQKEQQPSPSPSPSPQNQKKKDDKQTPQKDKKQDQQSQSDDKQNQDQQQEQNKDQQSKDGQQQDKQQQQQQDKGADKEKDQQKDENKAGDSKGSSPSPTPSDDKNGDEKNAGGERPTPSPSPSAGTDQQQRSEDKSGASPTPGENGNENGATPSPSPGEGAGQDNDASPSPSPSGSPGKQPTGEVKGAADEKPDEQKQAEVAEAEVEKDGTMSQKQAEMLLQSMKNEEQRVQLDERKAARHVYNDW